MSAIAWNAVRDGNGITVRHQWNAQNVQMARLIAFTFCIAFLVGAGASVRFGMALAALAAAGLAGYVAWCGVSLFIGRRR